MRSSDNGFSWEQLGVTYGVEDMVLQNNVLVLASQYGVARSLNNGETWQFTTDIACYAMYVNDTMIMIGQNGDPTIRYSMDQGSTWMDGVTLGYLPRGINFLEHNGAIYCRFGDFVHRSSDGITWNLFHDGLPYEIWGPSSAFNVLVIRFFRDEEDLYGIGTNGQQIYRLESGTGIMADYEMNYDFYINTVTGRIMCREGIWPLVRRVEIFNEIGQELAIFQNVDLRTIDLSKFSNKLIHIRLDINGQLQVINGWVGDLDHR